MSSREIAELLGCRHDNVKRTIDTLAHQGLVTFTQTKEKGLGRPVTLYHVGKRDSYVIVAQLSPELPPSWLTVGRSWRRKSLSSLRVFPATSQKHSVSPPTWRSRRNSCVCRTRP